jgi:hypothetical protein
MTGGEISILVWLSLGFALWHFCVLMPDKFVGGIGGALTVSLVGPQSVACCFPSLAFRAGTRQAR